MPRRQNLIANRSMKVKLFNQRYPHEALPPIVALIDEYGADANVEVSIEAHCNFTQ